MRVSYLTAGLLLTTAIVSATSLATLPASANQARVTCLCDCPDDHKVKPHAEVRPVMPARRRVARRVMRPAVRHYDEAGYYSYGAAAPVFQREWHGQWQAAPNDAFIPGPAPAPMAYGPLAGAYEPEMRVDDRGWTGGVGGGPDGGGGFMDGFGQVHFANGGSAENGPTYNSYNESFQFNPSQAGRFQPRLMGGLAPVKTK